MRLVFITLAILVVAGCEPYPADADRQQIARDIHVIHDAENKVTCWKMKNGYGGGLSCWPDQLLEMRYGDQ